ncbi:TPA: alpha/beta fold hydrolase [Candidatus Woesearchaeota archaeon]|nr:alpha/beta fold hydrolase [Candidatus Woesearchaeota archaeon]HII89133.1 alpha/beta fold hydrolase [Candidatus Woesearchaeota archaeon]
MHLEIVTFTNQRKEKLAGWLTIPDAVKERKKGGQKNEKKKLPVVIICHGYRSGKASTKGKLFTDLFAENFVILRFDFNGHGDSGGKFEDLTISKCVEDLHAAISYLETLSFVDKNKIAVQGSSMGGMTALLAGAADKRIKALLLFCPPSKFEDCDTSTFHKYDTKTWKEKGFNYLQGHGGTFKVKINYRFHEDGCLQDVYSAAERIKIPVLIFHGNSDQIVALKQSQELIKHLKHGKLEIVKGANHHYNDDVDLVTKLLKKGGSFLKEQLR